MAREGVPSGLSLCAFILMVRKGQVIPATVNIKCLAEE